MNVVKGTMTETVRRISVPMACCMSFDGLMTFLPQ